MAARERSVQLSLAGLIALALYMLTLLAPLNQLVWIVQSRMASFKASGDIVYVGANENLASPEFPRRRLVLAHLIDRLDKAGVKQVYVNIVFGQPTVRADDEALNNALRRMAGHAFLVTNVAMGVDGKNRLESSTSSIAQGVPKVGSDLRFNLLGYTWDSHYTVRHGDQTLPSLPAMLADKFTLSGQSFPISYFFDRTSIPTYSYESLASPDFDLSSLKGKKVVIGLDKKPSGASYNIPGSVNVPISLVSIYAAETLKAGQTHLVGGFVSLLFAILLLGFAAQLSSRRWRHTGYIAACAAIPIAFWTTAQFGIRISLASAFVFLLVYAILRTRTRMKDRLRLVDPDTDLPTFAALEADKDIAETIPAIVVAKIHRFEEVRKTLPSGMHSDYLLRMVDRLKAAKQDARIYLGQGHLIAFTFPEKEPALIRDHLEGLRALFSSPLQVGDTQVDVGITFGVDITPSPNVARRVAAAISAAERTTETYEPIEIAELASDEDLIWNISLQARIDKALANGEIYLIYQPKILVQTGEMVGVEALVRWRDPIRGLIPPDHFIRQCENAGRMSHLTRHVLTRACQAGNAFEDSGLDLPIAVNISATLVHECDIVHMVREVLDETGFAAQRLTLEITETYRISNFERAAQILSELAALGPKISMDDFGVGATSLEALQRLPFDEVKIDRMFTLAMKNDSKAAGIVRNVLRLGKDLRIIVVAEGVEDEATLTLLRKSGCLVAQGFGISRPVSFEEIVSLQSLRKSEPLKNIV